MNRKHRSYLAHYRCGILTLNIEIGRWRNIPLEDRIFKMCDSLVVEDEYYLDHVGNTILNINELNEIDKIRMFMSKEYIGYCAKIISEIIEKDMIICFLKLSNFKYNKADR